MSYCGYSNFETWAVNLWINNEEAVQETVQNAVKDILKDTDAVPVDEVAHWLQDYVEESMPDLGTSLWADLLMAALSEVDWVELGILWVSDMEEEVHNAT